jgi:LytS/YehU family sensor histidine kinase
MIKKKEIENSHLTALSQLQHKDITIKNILLVAAFLLLIFVVIIAFFIHKTSEAKKKRSEAALKQKIAEVQMQVLRAQMNPHFIFNSLNSIENFMMQNEKWLASDYLNKFTQLIRTILDSSFDKLIPVTRDMDALQLYIDLQQLRFNNKFTYQTSIDPQILAGDYKVPSLIIQPYVENAIEHGIAHSEKNNCRVSISVTLSESYLLYTVEDNGIGRQQAAAYNQQNKPNHKSVGLAITADRVHIFNGSEKDADDIVITDLYGPGNEPAGTSVQVKIKLF